MGSDEPEDEAWLQRPLPLRAIADRATELLVKVAAEDEAAARDYDDLLYLPLFRALKQRGNLTARDASRLSGSDVGLPTVRVEDLDEVAHDATSTGLARARAAALRFDPMRGDGATWALNASAMAYRDVVRDRYGVRRKHVSEPVDPAEMAEVIDQSSIAIDPARHAQARDALTTALRELSPEERFVVLGRFQSGLTSKEISLYLWGNEQATRKVDTLLQSARRKLRRAEERWRSGETA